jgi:hypothetical protein
VEVVIQECSSTATTSTDVMADGEGAPAVLEEVPVEVAPAEDQKA